MISVIQNSVRCSIKRCVSLKSTVRGCTATYVHGICNALPERKRSSLPQLWNSNRLSTMTSNSYLTFAEYEGHSSGIMDSLYQFISTKPPITENLWHDIKTKLDSSKFPIQNIWAIRLFIRITFQWPRSDEYGVQICKSLLSFMQSSDDFMHTLDNNLFLWSCYTLFLSINLECEGVTEDEIFELIENKIGESTNLQYNIAKNIITTYCNTSRWEKGLTMARALPDNQSMAGSMDVILAAACKSREYDIALEFFQRTAKITAENDLRLNRDGLNVVRGAIARDMLEAASEDESVLYKFLNIIAEEKMIMYKADVLRIKAWFERHKGWHGQLTTQQSGKCNNCSDVLKKIETVPADVVKELGLKFRNEYFTGHYNCYLMSPEDELTRFKEFLNDMEPVDVVIDALSVTHYKPNEYEPIVLLNTVKLLTEKMGLKVLTIGRKHMKGHAFKNIDEYAQTFWVDNTSKDDAFMICAALTSGPNTFIVSNDFFRDHIYTSAMVMDDDQAKYFRTWMKTRKVRFIYNDAQSNIFLKWPSQDAVCLQHTNESIHIPYDCSGRVANHFIKSKNVPKTILCLKKKGPCGREGHFVDLTQERPTPQENK